jgi:phosphoribosylamine--glycine ligase
MIKKNEPYLIEYNIRMGDPECQAILPRLNTDLVTIINKAIENRLDSINIKWKKKKSMTVVLCAKGYPGNYKKNIKLNNINKIKFFKNDYIYHAGTKIINKEFFSIGGRVLNITSTGDNYLKIRNKILKILKKFDLKHFFFRRDIGWKIINKNENYKRFP